jgi:hypothetical protein
MCNFLQYFISSEGSNMPLVSVCTPPELDNNIQPDAELATKLEPAHHFS